MWELGSSHKIPLVYRFYRANQKSLFKKKHRSATIGNTRVVKGTKTADHLRLSPYFASASSASIVKAGRAAEAATAGLKSKPRALGNFSGLHKKHHEMPLNSAPANNNSRPGRAMA